MQLTVDCFCVDYRESPQTRSKIKVIIDSPPLHQALYSHYIYYLNLDRHECKRKVGNSWEVTNTQLRRSGVVVTIALWQRRWLLPISSHITTQSGSANPSPPNGNLQVAGDGAGLSPVAVTQSSREPFVPISKQYSGNPVTCGNFLFQCCLLFDQQPTQSSDKSWIAFIIRFCLVGYLYGLQHFGKGISYLWPLACIV